MRSRSSCVRSWRTTKGSAASSSSRGTATMRSVSACLREELLRGSAGLEEATSRVWFSMEQAMRVSDDSWCRECWSLSQVPHGVVVQQLYACDHLVAGEDCPTLNTTTCDLTPKPSAANTLQKGKQHKNNKKGKRHAAGGAPMLLWTCPMPSHRPLPTAQQRRRRSRWCLCRWSRCHHQYLYPSS